MLVPSFEDDAGCERRFLAKRVAAAVILSLSLAWLSACTKTDRSIEINRSTQSSTRARLEEGAVGNNPSTTIFVASCNIERMNGKPPAAQPLAVSRKEPLSVEGWVVDEASPQDPPAHLSIVLQGVASGSVWHAAASGRLSREDVAQAKRAALLSGFRAELDTSSVTPGEYRLLVAFWQDGPLKLCDVGRRIMVE